MFKSSEFTLQRMVELGTQNPEAFLDRDIAIAKHSFPAVIEKLEDSLVGRGHHESYHLYVPTGQIICILWDEDHDERVFLAASDILRKLSANDQKLILMFGERKGNLTVVTINDIAKISLEAIIKSEMDAGCDSWQVQVVTSGSDLAESAIINDGAKVVGPYLQNILETRSALSEVWKCLELRDLEVKSRMNSKKLIS